MEKVYIIAEAGVNHNGDIQLAKELIHAAKEAGADAVKFQTFKAENLATACAPKAEYQKSLTSEEESQIEMLKKLELSYEEYIKLHEYASDNDIEFISSPFSIDDLKFLNELNLKSIKIPSGEISNAPMLYVAGTLGKKIILSTGASTLSEVEEALSILAFGFCCRDVYPTSRAELIEVYQSEQAQSYLKDNVSILHCCSEYPTPPQQVNLRAINTLNRAFGCKVGFSDHTKGVHIAVAAVSIGAKIIEKHFTLDNNMPGPDHKASLEINELENMISNIRDIEAALGTGVKIPMPSEHLNRKIIRKSMVACTNIEPGDLFSFKNVAFKRPGFGLSPIEFYNIIGTKASREYKQDEYIGID